MQEPLEIILKSVDRKDMLKRQTEKLILKMSVFSSLGDQSAGGLFKKFHTQLNQLKK